jgi:hypothetical protein
MPLHDRHRRRQAQLAQPGLRAILASAWHGLRAVLPRISRRPTHAAASALGYHHVGARDRAAVVAVAIEQISRTAQSDELLPALTSLLREEFADERQQAIADRGLSDA